MKIIDNLTVISPSIERYDFFQVSKIGIKEKMQTYNKEK
jgi:hypothetical protein